MDRAAAPSWRDVDPADHAGCRRSSAWSARARLAPEHGRLDDQQEALLRPGAADLDCADCGAFEVIGRATELRERARRRLGRVRRPLAARPWVDDVKIECPTVRCGAARASSTSATRGWTPASCRISTLKYRTTATYWEEWFPADFIDRGVPGAVPQLVLRAAHDEHGARRTRPPFTTPASATPWCVTSTARRCTRARATPSGSTTRPSRSAST